MLAHLHRRAISRHSMCKSAAKRITCCKSTSPILQRRSRHTSTHSPGLTCSVSACSIPRLAMQNIPSHTFSESKHQGHISRYPECSAR
ncbi:hypothetical protein IQ07DRAFT_59985 [Pyrenochaeta sp. DS3sAY3a]|nr:hypothetical protein IQ07DRAFT_59985 [Pyrenochaeta sp. DS3sAY3a]